MIFVQYVHLQDWSYKQKKNMASLKWSKLITATTFQMILLTVPISFQMLKLKNECQNIIALCLISRYAQLENLYHWTDIEMLFFAPLFIERKKGEEGGGCMCFIDYNGNPLVF